MSRRTRMFSWARPTSYQAELSFSPSEISGLTCWLDAAEAEAVRMTTVLEGETLVCSAWHDLSDTIADFTQGTAGLRPAYLAGGIKAGLGSLDFDGTNDLLTSSATLADIITASEFSMFAACVIDSWGPNSPTIALLPGLFGGHYSTPALYTCGIFTRSTATAHAFRAYHRDDATGALADVVQRTEDDSALQIVIFEHGAGNIYLEVDDNGAGQTSDLSGDTFTLTDGLRVGENFAGVYLNGKIGEVLVYNRKVTSGERTQIVDYLDDKWT